MASPSGPGWVYILTNPALPGMVKVGLTTRTPTARAAELTSSSGVPLPFSVAWARAVADCAAVEAAVHRMLDDRRVSGKREFFRVDAKTARQVIEAAAGAKLGRRYRAPPRKPLQRSRWKGRGRSSDRLPALMAITGAAVIATIAVLKPPVPGWLPHPLQQSLLTIERLHQL